MESVVKGVNKNALVTNHRYTNEKERKNYQSSLSPSSIGYSLNKNDIITYNGEQHYLFTKEKYKIMEIVDNSIFLIDFIV
jgi:hypothetical protein